MKERQVEDTKILEEKKGQAYYIDGKKTIILVCGGGFSGEEVKYCEGTGAHQHVLKARRGLCPHLEPEGGTGKKVAVAVLAFLTLHNLDGSWQIVGVIAPLLTLSSTLEHLLPLRI